MIITSCENSQSSETLWSVFDDDSIKVEDVVMSADEKELTNNQGEVNIVLTNNSDFELSYFCEDVCFQKKIGEVWYSWKKSCQGRKTMVKCTLVKEPAGRFPLGQITK